MKNPKTFFRYIAALFFVGASPQAAHAVCYVNGAAGGANNGSSWKDAYSNPQFALLNPSCDEIWVARGVYKPTLAVDPTVSFLVPSGVTLYGGFLGNEKSRDQRAPDVNVTILSGDLADDDANSGTHVDATSAAIRGTNSHHVIVMNGAPESSGKPEITGSTVVDGFVITGGDASEIGGQGGGLLCYGRGTGRADVDEKLGCSPTLRNLVFSGNAAAQSGGALFNEAQSNGASSPTLIDVVFAGNTAAVAGGAVYNNAYDGGVSNPTFTNVTFFGNSAASGGAVYSMAQGLRDGANGIDVGTSSPVFTSVQFLANSAQSGGAVYDHALQHGASAPRFSVTTFSENVATDVTAGVGGAIAFNAEGGSLTPEFINSTFSGNSAVGGGGIFSTSSNGGARVELVNVTFSGNIAITGGAIFNNTDVNGDTRAALINVILWDDIARNVGGEPEVENVAPVSSTTIDHSVIQGGCPAIVLITCTHLLLADPKLAPLDENGGFTRTMLPGWGSSAIDTGLDAACPDIDQRGLSRPQGSHCEVGAVEVFPLPPPVADPKSIVVLKNSSKEVSFSASDSNTGGPFVYTYAVVTGPTHGLLTVPTTSTVYVPTKDYVGPDSFTYTATDVNGTSVPATVLILVIPPPPPVALPFDVTTPRNTPKSITLAATDENPGGPFAYTFALVDLPTHGSVALVGDVATYTPNTDYTGLDSFTYTATDVNGISAPATVTIHVLPVVPPEALPRVIVVPYNTSKVVKFGATDSNPGGPFAYAFAVASVPGHGMLGPVESDNILYTPTHNYSGPDVFTYIVTDVNGVSSPATVTITVLPPGAIPPGTLAAVPTLSVWGLLALVGSISLICGWRVRRS